MFNALAAIFKFKCPRCYRGDMFAKPFKIQSPLAMPEKCGNCDQPTEPEVGFYYGAMMVSYILSGFSFVFIGFSLIYFLGWTLNATMALIIAYAAITYIPLMRISRIIWLHICIRKDPRYFD